MQVADSKTVMLGEATNEAQPDNEQNDVSIVEPTLPSNDTQTGIVILYHLTFLNLPLGVVLMF